MHYLAEFPPCQKEFWFVLAGIHLQTNAHVTAAPSMAHYLLACITWITIQILALCHHLAIVEIEHYLLKKDTLCIICMVNGTPMTYGNIAIVFLGEFCQLPTIAGQNIYCNENSIDWGEFG